MGDRTAELSIDRIDVNGNYTPRTAMGDQRAAARNSAIQLTEKSGKK